MKVHDIKNRPDARFTPTPRAVFCSFRHADPSFPQAVAPPSRAASRPVAAASNERDALPLRPRAASRRKRNPTPAHHASIARPEHARDGTWRLCARPRRRAPGARSRPARSAARRAEEALRTPRPPCRAIRGASLAAADAKRANGSAQAAQTARDARRRERSEPRGEPDRTRAGIATVVVARAPGRARRGPGTRGSRGGRLAPLRAYLEREFLPVRGHARLLGTLRPPQRPRPASPPRLPQRRGLSGALRPRLAPAPRVPRGWPSREITALWGAEKDRARTS